MAEMLPLLSIEDDPEAFISFLKQEDAREGVVSNDAILYDRILEKWRDGDISDKEAIVDAKAILATRQENYH